MKNIKALLLILAIAGMASITQIKAQTTTTDNTATTTTTNTSQTQTPAAPDYTWVIAISVIGAGILVAIIYRSRRNKKEDGRPMEDESINNPASGI